MVNLGGLRSFIIAQGLLIPFLLVLSLLPWCCTRVKLWIAGQVHEVFFNQLIAFIDSTFFVVAITGMLNAREVYYGALEVDTSFMLSIAAMLTCLIELVAITVFLRHFFKKDELDEPGPKRRCGFIYQDLNYKIRGGWTLFYPIFYQVRFALIAGSAVLLGNYLVVQVMIVVISTIIVMGNLGLMHPNREVRKNYIEIGNEAVIIFVLDLLLFSSSPDLDPVQRSAIGYVMIAVLLISMLYNYGSMFLEALRKVKLRCKLCSLRRRTRSRLRQLAQI